MSQDTRTFQASKSIILALFSARIEIFRRKPETEKNSHAGRVIIPLACSSANITASPARTLKDAAVWQVCLALRLMRLVAQSRVRHWDNGAKELRLLPRIQRLL